MPLPLLLRKHVWFWVTAALAAAALIASAILLIDYVRPQPVFCEVNGACDVVKHTPFAKPLGIPMPAIGLAGMLGIALASLVPGREARLTQAALASIGAAVATMLFGVQAHLGVLCPFCAIVDTSAILLAILSFVRVKTGWDPPRGRAIPATVAMGLIASIAVPAAMGILRKPPPPPDRSIPIGIPDTIAQEMKRTPRGVVTIVDFVDFECPFCRMTHEELAPLIAERKDKVHVVRKHVPLRMHAHAMDAARAGCCGETLGKGDELANLLFAVPPDGLTIEGCEKLAVETGLDLEAFRACVKDPATTARIEKDKEAFRDVKGHGLPTIWIDGTRLEGAQKRAVLEKTIDTAIRAL